MNAWVSAGTHIHTSSSNSHLDDFFLELEDLTMNIAVIQSINKCIMGRKYFVNTF